jgi:CheY-like chemotaxis protein
MVYGTLKAHRATIGITSTLGRGTEVLLSFPPIPQGRPAAPGEASQDSAPRAKSTLTILLVDDDELIREAIPPMLELLGHSVILAAGGQEALDRCQSGLDPDLVILDMNMPGLTGSETLAQLLAFRPHQPVLLASGYNDQNIRQHVLQHPSVFSLQKPFTLHELQDKLAVIRAAMPSK